MYKDKEVNKPETVVNGKTTDPIKSKEITVKEAEKTVATVTTTKENSTEKNIKPKKRRFRLEEFSRAPLSDRYIKEEIKAETPKTKTD